MNTRKFTLEGRKLGSYTIAGIDYDDSPDFCDAFVSEAEWGDGTKLTDEEFDKLNDNKELVYRMVIDWLY